jgi:hypothetical protein
MAGVVVRQLFDAGQSLFEGCEGDQALAGWVETFETGILSQDRFAAGKIADATLNQPLLACTYIFLATINSALLPWMYAR